VAPELRQPVPNAFPRPIEAAEEDQPLAPSSDLAFRNPVRLVDIELDQELVYLLLTATSQQTLRELCPSFLNHYLDHPTLGDDRHWSPAARATRALRAGVSARRVLTGAFHKQARSLSLTVTNNVEGWFLDISVSGVRGFGVHPDRAINWLCLPRFFIGD